MNTFPDSVDWSGSGDKLPCENVIHVMYQNPVNPYWGVSPLQSVGRVVDTEVQAMLWWKMSLARMAVKDGIMSLKEPLPQDQWQEYRNMIEREIVGARKSHGVILIGEEVDYKPISSSAKELDWIDSRKLSREDIVAAFGIPPILVNILDRASFSNFEQAQVHYWTNVAVPFLELLRTCINKSLVHEFGDPAKLRVWFDLDKVPALRYDLDKKVSIMKDLFYMGTPLRSAADVVGLEIPRFQGDETSYIASNLLPAEAFDVEMVQTVANATQTALGRPEDAEKQLAVFRSHLLKDHGPL
jgi:HK97 family phage portal protein